MTVGLAQDVKPDSEPERETIYRLPLLEDLPRPTPDQLLHGRPADWILVLQERVLQVDPVQPRPNTLKKMQLRIDEFAKTKPQTTDTNKINAWRREFDKVRDLTVTLWDDNEPGPYWILINEIDAVIHHETMAIEEAARQREAGAFNVARELLEHVRRRDDQWPGLIDAENELLFAEGSAMIVRGDAEQGLATLERLYERDPEFLLLETRTGQAVRTIATEALADNNPRKVRYFTGRLRRLYPKHAVAKELDEARLSRAKQLLAEAEAASPRAAAELIREVARFAPEMRGLRIIYDRLFNRHPVLHVGTITVARPAKSGLLQALPARRYDELTNARLFEQESREGDLVRYRSRHIESWRPEDLGRRAVLELGTNRDGLDAYRLAEVLQKVVDQPDQYGDRWYGAIHGIHPVGPRRLMLDLGRGPLRLDAFLGLLPLELAGEFESVPAPNLARTNVIASAAFRSTTPSEERPRGQFFEVIEHQFSDAESFTRALRRDEVDMAVDVPPHLLARLTQDEWFANEVILQTMELPTTHVLQFRAESPLSRSRELRVALERALNRKRLLAEAMLHSDLPSDGSVQTVPGAEFVRLATGPYPSFSYANRPTATPRVYAPPAAVPLALLARRQLGDDWRTFRMIAPGDRQIREAAEQMVGHWRLLGLPVELVPSDESDIAIESGQWDIVYRVVSMAEPSLELWPFLSSRGVATLTSVSHLSEPFRRRLLRLDNTRDWPTMSALLADAHRAMLEEALVIPLWEVDRLCVRRRSIRGVPDKCLTPYDGIKQWRVEPVFSLRND